MPWWKVPHREQKQLVYRAPLIGSTNLGRAASRAWASASARAAREAATSCSRAWASATVIEACGSRSPSSSVSSASCAAATEVASVEATDTPLNPRTAAATPPASSALSRTAGRRCVERSGRRAFP